MTTTAVTPSTSPPPHAAPAARPGMFWGLAMLAFLLVAPFIGLYPVFMMNALCFAIFACAFNLLLGYTGLLSFGHAAFFGSAAYATGWLVRSGGLTPELGILAGTAVAGVLGFLVGAIAIRRQGIYFAMITLAMAQMIYFVALQAPFTGGEDGLQGVPRGKLFGLLSLADDRVMYYLVVAVSVAVYLGVMRIVHSPFGQVLKAIRENEPRAISLGYDADRYKLLAFTLSCALAGLAGALKTVVLGFVTLSDVHWSLSGEVILMTLMGGLGTFVGPVIGAFGIIGLQHFLPDATWSTVALGGCALGIAVMLLRGRRLTCAPMLLMGALLALTAVLKAMAWQQPPEAGSWLDLLVSTRVSSWVPVIIGGIFVLCVLAFRSGIAGELMGWWSRRDAAARTRAS